MAEPYIGEPWRVSVVPRPVGQMRTPFEQIALYAASGDAVLTKLVLTANGEFVAHVRAAADRVVALINHFAGVPTARLEATDDLTLLALSVLKGAPEWALLDKLIEARETAGGAACTHRRTRLVIGDDRCNACGGRGYRSVFQDECYACQGSGYEDRPNELTCRDCGATLPPEETP